MCFALTPALSREKPFLVGDRFSRERGQESIIAIFRNMGKPEVARLREHMAQIPKSCDIGEKRVVNGIALHSCFLIRCRHYKTNDLALHRKSLMTPFQERLCGNVPAVLTALDERFQVDRDSLRRITRRLIDHGCRGVVVLGTSGEFASIDDDQREIAIRAVVDEIGGQLPVIVGCGQPNARRTHEQAKAAADLGADGLLVNPPFYFPMTQDEVVRYFADLVSASPVPVLLYNIPLMTKVTVAPATIPRLCDIGVQGTKDSSGSPANTLAYLAALGPDSDFRVVVGGDTCFLHLLDAGACATTGLLGNVAPQLDVRIYDAWRAGDYQAGFAAQRRANALAYVFLALHDFLPASGKAILSKLGLMENWVAPPKTSMTDAETIEAFGKVREFLPEFECHK